MSDAVVDEILHRVRALPEDQQREFLDRVRSLETPTPRGVPGKGLLRFAGTIPDRDLERIRQAIEDGCERVDANGW